MDKRGYVEVESPPNYNTSGIKKQRSMSTSENTENNCNKINLDENFPYPGFDINDCLFDDEDFEIEMHQEIDKLDLSIGMRRCKVKYIEVHRKRFEKILQVQDERESSTSKCCLKGIWYETEVSQGDVVSISGTFNVERKLFIISNDSGIIVVHPDQLISGTSIVGSIFCARKAVLAERFRGVDDAVGGDSKMVMHVGSIVHEILQRALKDNLATLQEIKTVASDILSSPEIIQTLYANNAELKQLESDLQPYLLRIFEFIQKYMIGNNKDKQTPCQGNLKPFEGRVAEVKDIEENLWNPRLGLKGKIDITASVYSSSNFNTLRPIEVKTGKPSFSIEHKGQLILYQMMMKDLGQHIDSGLLLYIKDGIIGEINASRSDECGLISLRNRFAKFMIGNIVERDKTINLPEPISHHSACEKCPYNVVCCTFLNKDKRMLVPTHHPIYKVQARTTAHLTGSHYSYFLHWCHLITLEHNEMQKSFKIKHLWTKTPEFRAAKGNALINLRIKNAVLPQNGEFIHEFASYENLSTTQFEVGDYLIVSIAEKRVFITAGRVLSIEPSQITMLLQKDLSRQHANEKFHLDKYESQSQSIFNFSNIGILLENSEERGINQLRSIIIDKIPAKFTNTLSKSIRETCDKILSQLNPVQRTAILKALTCENYMLIKGLPGTGKSQTLVSLIHILTAMKKSILITSHTNSAVDNILLRLKERGVRFLRLGSNARIHKSIQEFSESCLIEKCKTVEDLEEVYERYQVVACTCLGSGHALLSRKRFDYCLVDEATQIFQPTVIRPLLSADRFILVGDPQQLAPLVRSNDARVLGANESLFERLDNENATFVLGIQYRMNRTITKLANSLTYKGELKCANEDVEKAVMEIPQPLLLKDKLMMEKWLNKVLSSHLDMACTLINTGDVYQLATNYLSSKNGEQKENSKLYVNYCEIAIVLRIVELLLECGVAGSSIGIIAPYRDQVDALKKVFAAHHTVEVNTVDTIQGRDKKIIIYSCTLSGGGGGDTTKASDLGEILEDRRRLTVAITRAKHKLIMVGDVNCLNKYTPFRDLFKSMNAISKVQILDETFGFSWEVLLRNVDEKLK